MMVWEREVDLADAKRNATWNNMKPTVRFNFDDNGRERTTVSEYYYGTTVSHRHCNLSPSKTRPRIQAAGGISARNKSRGGTCDRIHGIPQESFLVMEDASRGIEVNMVLSDVERLVG